MKFDPIPTNTLDMSRYIAAGGCDTDDIRRGLWDLDRKLEELEYLKREIKEQKDLIKKHTKTWIDQETEWKKENGETRRDAILDAMQSVHPWDDVEIEVGGERFHINVSINHTKRRGFYCSMVFIQPKTNYRKMGWFSIDDRTETDLVKIIMRNYFNK